MQKINALLLIVSVMAVSGIANAYTSSIYDPAVVSGGTSGQLTLIQLNVTPGNGSISVKGPAIVAQDTLVSAETGAAYAAKYLGMNASIYDFKYTINDSNANVSGPSAGLAFTLLAISGLEQKPLLNDFAVTGTISGNGTAGAIGGIYDKAAAARRGGKSFMIVPYVRQSDLEYLFYYAAQQSIGIPFAEAENASEAASYAFGQTQPLPISYNYSSSYSVRNLPNANESCNSCNVSYFYPLENFTLNFTSSEIGSMGSNFSALKQQMLSVLSSYSTIGGSGYLYTASDFAFNEYIDAFTAASIKGSSLRNASSTINMVSNYCSSLSPPQLTAQNYEYVIGGRLRQALAQSTINDSLIALNSSTSSDGITLSLRDAGTAYAWCKAAYQMYNIAYSIGGNNVTYNQNVRQIAGQYLSEAAQESSSNTYLSIATESYDKGDYYTAIYASIYSMVFDSNSGLNASAAQSMYANATRSQFGIWSKEFALQSGFFLYQANQTSNKTASNSYLTTAYSSALLSSMLAAANRQISSNFTNATAAYAQPAGNIQNQLNEIFGMLALIFIALIIIFIILLKNEINGARQHAPSSAQQAVSRNRRKRR